MTLANGLRELAFKRPLRFALLGQQWWGQSVLPDFPESVYFSPVKDSEFFQIKWCNQVLPLKYETKTIELQGG